jgi:hypothetical protein
MSFYLDEYPEEDQTGICPHCSGRDFYPDPISGTLTCSSCYTQSQSQHEEIDIDEGLGLAAMTGKRTKTSSAGVNGGRGGKVARDLSEYDASRKLPDAESCCLAFQWLLLDASKCVMALSEMSEQRPNYHDHSLLELTVKQIWFAYLETWTNAARYYSKKYPEMRVSFRDLFLSDIRKSVIARHLSVTVGRRVEEEMIHEMQMKIRSEKGLAAKDDMSLSSTDANSESGRVSTKSYNYSSDNSTTKKRKHRPVLSIPKLCSYVFNQHKMRERYRLPNGCFQIHPFKAVLQIQPSLTLLLSILQLALLHLKTGYAAYQLTSWVANGSLPHALNGYALLPTELKERVNTVNKFFIRSFVPPADDVDELTFLLAASIGWFRDAPSQDEGIGDRSEQKLRNAPQPNNLSDSLYNVPLLAARMVQDLGFGQQVLDNALTLMGLHQDSRASQTNPNASESNHVEISLSAASPKKLYTPLHVASVIIVACKLCCGWETWRISNLHCSSTNTKFVPWNGSQINLLGNGPILNGYIGFLKSNALNGLECSDNVSQFFQTLNKNVSLQNERMPQGLASEHVQPSVAPNTLLAGALNPNDQSVDASNSSSTKKGKYYMSREPLHPSYSRLIEYVCYSIEETNPAMLHELVLILEDEMIGGKAKAEPAKVASKPAVKTPKRPASESVPLQTVFEGDIQKKEKRSRRPVGSQMPPPTANRNNKQQQMMGNTPTKSIHPERGSPEQEPDAADDESTNEEPDLQEAPADEEVAITPSTPTKPHKFDTNWSSNLAELIQYKYLHGSTSVPVKSKIYSSLGKWCKNQRLSYHKGKLRPDRIEALKSAGFVFEGNIPRPPARAYPSNIKRWEAKLQQLMEYKARYGDCHVLMKHDRELWKWCENQRGAYRKGQLSEERVEKLRNVGFNVVDDIDRSTDWECCDEVIPAAKTRCGKCRKVSTVTVWGACYDYPTWLV